MYGIRVLSCFVDRFRCCRERFYSKGSKKLMEFLATMPKVNSGRIADAQHQRRIINKKSEKYSPSTIYLQVLGSGARGAPNTLYLFTDQKRYLFNCGECTQRLAHEHKVKLSKLEHIFITSKSWRNIGGLPGLSLTLQDVGVPNITLHGPEGLDELYNATKRFVVMKDMNVTMAPCSTAEDFEDNCMTVKYVLLVSKNIILKESLLKSDETPAAKKAKLDPSNDKKYEEFIHDDTDYYNSKRDPKQKEQKNDKVKASFHDEVKRRTEKVLYELQKKGISSVAYICKLKNRPGTLDLAKCVEKGVKPGPMLGQLKNGQDVILPNGTVVLSKDVKTPDDPGPVFIVMEVPDLSYLNESDFAAHFDNRSNPPENIPTLIVHFTPPHVFNDTMYRKFLAKFGPTTRHLVLNSQNSCLGSEAVHRTQHKLHLLDIDIFPLLRDASVPAVWNSYPPPANNDSPTRRGMEDLKNKIALAQFQSIINMESSKAKTDQECAVDEEGTKLEIIKGKTLTMFHLRPKRQLDRSAEPKLHIQDYIQETMDVDGFVDSLEHFKKLADNVRYANKNTTSKEFPKVIFLGTGSCIPSKTRNTSAIVVQINENSSMLLDCGEGTFGQLVRFFGPKKVNSFLKTLHVIYVSHLHADHHIGLIGVLQARREAFLQSEQEPLPVNLLAPGQIYTWLSLYDQAFEKIKPDFTLIPNQSLLESAPPESSELSAAVLAQIGANKISTCYVSHCPNAFGVSLQADQHKITYSGDTIPCEALVKLGKDSTLLIHEATMEDDLSDEARVKMHSTTSQAIQIGSKMNAQYTVLTHFSQRYARLPRLNQTILTDNYSVGIAFDNMQITMNDLPLLPYMYAPLQLMFAEHCVEMEMKAVQRSRHKERQLPQLESGPANSVTRASNSNEDKAMESPANPPKCNKKPAHIGTSLHANYRESNASRLRQEMKGMPVSGSVRPILRKNTSSPVRVSPIPRDNKNVLIPKNIESENILRLPSHQTVSQSSNMTNDSRDFNNKVTSEHSLRNSPTPKSAELEFVIHKADVSKRNKIQRSPAADKKTSNLKYPNITSLGYGNPLLMPMKAKLFIQNTPVTPCPNVRKLNPAHLKQPVKSAPVKNKTSAEYPAKSRIITKDQLLNRSTLSENRLGLKSPEITTIVATATDKNKMSNIPRPSSWSNAAKSRASTLRNEISDRKRDVSPATYFRNFSTEQLKQQFCKDISMLSSGKRSPPFSKNFKPQLEDIKSSNLLLQEQLENIVSEKTDSAIPKPKPLNENLRKKQLDEAKKKFASKTFRHDSRYEKIEGLNWITWK